MVEVMGQEAGWIAIMAGIAGGADEILIPEVPFTMDKIFRNLTARHEAGRKFSLVVIAKGVHWETICLSPVPDYMRDECGHENS